MNTVFLLMAEFETTQVPLEHICEKYLDLDWATVLRKAKLQQLPFPVFRAGTQKSPWLVNINDLAEYLDERRATAIKDWKRMQSITDASHPEDEDGCNAEGSTSSHAA